MNRNNLKDENMNVSISSVYGSLEYFNNQQYFIFIFHGDGILAKVLLTSGRCLVGTRVWMVSRVPKCSKICRTVTTSSSEITQPMSELLCRLMSRLVSSSNYFQKPFPVIKLAALTMDIELLQKKIWHLEALASSSTLEMRVGQVGI